MSLNRESFVMKNKLSRLGGNGYSDIIFSIVVASILFGVVVSALIVSIDARSTNLLINKISVNGVDMYQFDLKSYFNNVVGFKDFYNNLFGKFAIFDSLISPIANHIDFGSVENGFKSIANILIVLVNALIKPIAFVSMVINFFVVLVGYSYSPIANSFMVFQIPYIEF